MKGQFALWLGGLYAIIASLGVSAATVENVRAQQRSRSNVVEVFYDLVAPEGGVFEVSLAIVGGGDEPPLSTLSGDIGADIIPGKNKKIEWDAGADWSQHVQSNFVATVTAIRLGPDAESSDGMVRIPGGTNSGVDPWGGDSWTLPYSLSVESFYMDKTEVTYAHWQRVVSWARAHGYSFTSNNVGKGKGNNHPVYMVSWYDCVKWCNARSEMEGRTPAYRIGNVVYRRGQSNPSVELGGNGYRLPTDTEWEYAARGGLHDSRFPWGNTISHAKANYCGSRLYSSCSYDVSSGYHPRYNDGIEPYTAPVASFAANRYGLYDMVGNVWEWCTTAWDQTKSIRGGSWYDSVLMSSAGGSDWVEPSVTASLIGFRTVRRQ